MAPSEIPHTTDANIPSLNYGSIILIDLNFFQSDQQHMLSYLPLGTSACECLVVDTLKPTDPTPSIQIVPLMPETSLLRDSGQYPYMTTLVGDGGLVNRWYSTKKYAVEPSSYGPTVKQLHDVKITDEQLRNVLGIAS